MIAKAMANGDLRLRPEVSVLYFIHHHHPPPIIEGETNGDRLWLGGVAFVQKSLDPWAVHDYCPPMTEETKENIGALILAHV